MRIILLILVFAFSALCFSQDPFFTNTQQSLVYLNPSFSGSNGFIRNQAIYRGPMSIYSYPLYVTFGNTFDAYIKPIRGGISASVFLDEQGQGLLRMSSFSFAYAQHFSLFKNKLKVIPSLQATYIQERLNKSYLNFGDLINSRYPEIWNSQTTVPVTAKTITDFSSGLLFQTKYFNFGAAVFHLLQPNLSLFDVNKLPTKITLHASYNFLINRKANLNVTGLTNIQSNFSFSALNATLVYQKLIFGLGFTSASDVIATVGLHFKSFNVCYTIDGGPFKFSENRSTYNQLSLSLNLRKKAVRDSLANMENW